MSSPAVSLGYVIYFVKDVSASLAFYEKAFGLNRRFLMGEGGKAYGELETGAARLGFLSQEMALEQLKGDMREGVPNPGAPGFEIALVTDDVPGLFARAVGAGAIAVSEPEKKPWGQLVAHVRDNDGHAVEICTPLP